MPLCYLPIIIDGSTLVGIDANNNYIVIVTYTTPGFSVKQGFPKLCLIRLDKHEQEEEICFLLASRLTCICMP